MAWQKHLFKSVTQLGWQQSSLFGWYQLQLRMGRFRTSTPLNPSTTLTSTIVPPFSPPTREQLKNAMGEDLPLLIHEAQGIINTQVRLFGNAPVLLDLIPRAGRNHWTEYHSSHYANQDIKLTWEPARFGWATTLARAYHITKHEKYAHTFWRLTQQFSEYNPPNQGPNWASAQEVGLRLIHLCYSYTLIEKSVHTTPWRKQTFAKLLAQHAERIPPTLSYARAQNNNHLLSESAALYTAGVVLPDHPKSSQWKKLGWTLFHKAINAQIADDGTYVQHSTNYHRLMLQLALWMQLVGNQVGQTFPVRSTQKLAAATEWLMNQTDPESGLSTNLGHNDGAYILPLTTKPIANYRPVLQAALQVFTGKPIAKDDEMALWFCSNTTPSQSSPEIKPNTLRHPRLDSWANLRVTNFKNRPAHADLLNLSLWLKGQSITLDPGTYMYNADPPWDNALMGTGVHNTVTVGNKDQMTRASRFLWLDWVKSEVVDQTETCLTAQHTGYKLLTHQRSVTTTTEGWEIKDLLNGQVNQKSTARLHWLLPDWEYTIVSESEKGGTVLNLQSPHGAIQLTMTANAMLNFSIVRAGTVLQGDVEVPENRGWFSPRYAFKQPALSLAWETESSDNPIEFKTIFQLPS